MKFLIEAMLAAVMLIIRLDTWHVLTGLNRVENCQRYRLLCASYVKPLYISVRGRVPCVSLI